MGEKLGYHFVGHGRKRKNPGVLRHHHVRLTRRPSCLNNVSFPVWFRSFPNDFIGSRK